MDLISLFQGLGWFRASLAASSQTLAAASMFLRISQQTYFRVDRNAVQTISSLVNSAATPEKSDVVVVDFTNELGAILKIRVLNALFAAT